MTIHGTDPFATPEAARSPVRRLRGRLAAAVTLWTAPGPAGLTVSSTLIADGAPARLLGLIDEESELWAAVQRERVFAVSPLAGTQRQLADRFAGLLPAPGGLFRFEQWRETPYGPVLGGDDAASWVGCRLDTARPYGFGLLVEATIERVEVGDDPLPLVHYRGRYREMP
jgi:3-hydroxy-9,10-secoandrosta-1,3,5(10)-triene-9,17-dione monooxygenase reductase component